MIKQANNWQVLRVTAADMAGNVLTTGDIQVLISPSLWVQYYMNKPLFFGTIVVLILLFAGIAILTAKRRKSI